MKSNQTKMTLGNRANEVLRMGARCRGVLTLALAVVATSGALAQADDISLGLPGYGGTGCPAGSASATLSPDAKTLSILFDAFTVEAGSTTGRSVDRKNCQIAVPVHIPNGWSVSIIGVDYRGFNGLPAGARSELRAEYFFAGSSGPKLRRTFVGPTLNDYQIHNDLAAGAFVWSACGADVSLRIASSIMAVTNAQFDQTQMTLDSIDMSAGLIFHLQFRQCIGGQPVGPVVDSLLET